MGVTHYHRERLIRHHKNDDIYTVHVSVSDCPVRAMFSYLINEKSLGVQEGLIMIIAFMIIYHNNSISIETNRIQTHIKERIKKTASS